MLLSYPQKTNHDVRCGFRASIGVAAPASNYLTDYEVQNEFTDYRHYLSY